MLLRIGYDLSFDVPAPTPIVLMLYVHPDRAGDLVEPERILIEPEIPISDFIDCFGNRCARIVAPAGRVRLRSNSVIRDTGLPEAHNPQARQAPINDLPLDVLQFLLASRYCEVDQLSNIGWELFGRVDPGWPRVAAICNWVYENVRFGYSHARPTKSAWDVYFERRGVCRDFMHLAIAFCRCVGIPARYATGYLGDIGVPPVPEPMDFSAYFEVYLDGKWWSLDARHNMARIGRVLMARGRDAVDVALTTSFGQTRLANFSVVTDELKE